LQGQKRTGMRVFQ